MSEGLEIAGIQSVCVKQSGQQEAKLMVEALEALEM